MRKHMATTGLIDVEANDLVTHRALRHQRIKAPPSDEPYELNEPYGQVPHSLTTSRRNDAASP
ncbi:MAG: hypothetical protein ACLP0B_26070 [Steroidobacteraceae bacterium]|jgi:hypothetical protein